MSIDRENDLTPQVVIYGAVDPEALQKITFYLTVIGIGCQNLPNLGIDESLGTHQSFAEIKSPDDYIIKEGFDNFQETQTHPEYGTRLITSLFSSLVDSRSAIWRQDWVRQFNDAGEKLEYVPQPREGIVVKSRRELGILPYPKGLLQPIMFSPLRLTVDYAIQAGSIVEASRPLVEVRDGKIDRLKKALASNRHDSAFMAIGDALLQNFESAA